MSLISGAAARLMEMRLKRKTDHNVRPTSRRLHLAMCATLGVLGGALSLSSPVVGQDDKFGAKALAAYCEGQARELSIIREADERFGIQGTDEKLEWIKERSADNYTQIEADIGFERDEWSEIAENDGWRHRCEAISRGWLAITAEDVAASTSADAKRVSEALELAYLKMMKRGEFKNHQGQQFTAINCKSDVIEGFRLVGCTLIGGGFLNGFYSQPLMFMVARQNEQTAFVPIESDTKKHIDAVSYGDVKGDPVMTGWYVGSYPFPFDWQEAVARLS